MNKIEGINTRHYGEHPQSSNVKSLKKARQTPPPFDEFYKAAIAMEESTIMKDATTREMKK